jgi:AMP-binding enzyme
MPDILAIYAQSQPDKLAVIDDRGGGEVLRWTYRELEEHANRLANALLSLGIQPGEKVIWCGPNSAQVVAAIGATRKAGGVAVPLNYRLTADEAQHVVGHSDATIAYVDAEHAPMFAALRDRIDRLRHVIVYGGPPLDGMLGDGSRPGPGADRRGAAYDRSSMKHMIANAAPWRFALKLQYLADFPEDSLWEVYGSTELGVDCVLEQDAAVRGLHR